MKVLHLDSGREMRGGQWQVVRLFEGLQVAGIDSTLLARRDSPLFETARRRGWSVEPLGATRILALAGKHDLIHAHDSRSHTLATIAAGTPLVISRRVAFPIRSLWKYRRVRMVIAVSSFVKSVLQRGGVPEDKITVIYDGVPLLAARRGTALLAVENSTDPQKGASLAAAAARVAGVPLEFTADLERDLSRAAVFLYLTRSEGLGSAALLAMSAAVPVIASRVGGLPEIIRHGENGLLVENSAPAVAQAIRSVIDRSEYAACLGEAARRTVEEQFTAGRMVGLTMEVYRRVLS